MVRPSKPPGFSLTKETMYRFSGVRHREFWLSALVLFFRFYLIDRLDPNKVRYWKHIYEGGPGGRHRVMRMLHGLDRLLLRLPLVRRLAWNIVIIAEK